MNRGAMGISAVDLRTEYRVNPLGIDANQPRLSWRLLSNQRGTLQTAYQVRVANKVEHLGDQSDLVWDSGKVESARSVHVAYAGTSLESRKRYYWQVRVWTINGGVTEWSPPACWEMGLLLRSDWQAQWITPPIDTDPAKSTPAPLLRSAFKLSGNMRRARAYITSLGLYELYLNEQRVGDALFTPGWTSFEKRLQYQVYDITSLLRSGPNAVGVMLGDGWYRWMPFHKNGARNNGKPFALLLQIEVTYDDGCIQYVLTDSSWKSVTGPILCSEIYNGEVYDARIERNGWAGADYNDADWTRTSIMPPPDSALVATAVPPVRRIEELKPVRIFVTPGGTTVADIGQNMVGWVRLRARGSAGTTVTLRHAEVLDAAGNFYTENLRTAEQKVQYTLKGRGEETFEPHFTFQGFRYVAVEDYPGELTPESLTGVVIHSDLEQTGQLETSSPMLNRLQRNILWTQKGNFLDVPTDCPQRNERLGWAFDAERFSLTSAFNMNVATFFAKWLADLAADQTADGAIPMEAPRANHWKYPVNQLYASGGRVSEDSRVVALVGVPAYGDAITAVPWNMYLVYGDTQILRNQYDSMVRWVRYVGTQAGEDHIWEPILSLGDWLDVGTTSTQTWFGSNSYPLMATAFYARSVDILQRTAALLDREEDATQYGKLLADIRESFRRRFVSDDGRIGSGMQTDYLLALDFDLVPPSLRSLAVRRLVEDVRVRGHMTTGIGGTQPMLKVLSRFGFHDEAYALLMRREIPSWLYQVEQGATTVWERWDGIKKDGSLQNPAMNSFNHYALGAVGEWMFSVMAGIAFDPAAPGYKHILIQPKPGGDLTSVNASYVTPYGEVSVSWRIDQGNFHLGIAIPPNTAATVTLPNARLEDVLENESRVVRSNGIHGSRQVGSNTVVEIGSGQYKFTHRYLSEGSAGSELQLWLLKQF